MAGITLIVLTGLIHAIEAPDHLQEMQYVGILFIANAVGAAVAAVGIWRGSRAAWGLGVLVAAGAFVSFILSRTTGLPGGYKEAEWEPLGIASLVIEAAFCVVAARALGGAPARRTPSRASRRPISVS
jgi:hypothetical protein